MHRATALYGKRSRARCRRIQNDTRGAPLTQKERPPHKCRRVDARPWHLAVRRNTAPRMSPQRRPREPLGHDMRREGGSSRVANPSAPMPPGPLSTRRGHMETMRLRAGRWARHRRRRRSASLPALDIPGPPGNCERGKGAGWDCVESAGGAASEVGNALEATASKASKSSSARRHRSHTQPVRNPSAPPRGHRDKSTPKIRTAQLMRDSSPLLLPVANRTTATTYLTTFKQLRPQSNSTIHLAVEHGLVRHIPNMSGRPPTSDGLDSIAAQDACNAAAFDLALLPAADSDPRTPKTPILLLRPRRSPQVRAEKTMRSVMTSQLHGHTRLTLSTRAHSTPFHPEYLFKPYPQLRFREFKNSSALPLATSGGAGRSARRRYCTWSFPRLDRQTWTPSTPVTPRPGQPSRQGLRPLHLLPAGARRRFGRRRWTFLPDSSCARSSCMPAVPWQGS